jgi:hypothetical protein
MKNIHGILHIDLAQYDQQMVEGLLKTFAISYCVMGNPATIITVSNKIQVVRSLLK